MDGTTAVMDHPAGWDRPRRAIGLAEAQARSRFLRVFRWACVAMAALSMLSIFVAIGLSAMDTGLLEEPLEQTETLTMLAPRFTGRSDGGVRFTITAQTATRQGPDSALLALHRPRMTTADGRVVVAERGMYDMSAETLELSGNVTLTQGDGLQVTSAKSVVHARRNQAISESPVVVSGGLGEARANAYELSEGGRRLTLRGKVRGIIRSSGSSAAAAQP